jgi:predicted kinase
MKKLLITIGLPNSGKTTIRKKYYQSYKCISFDDVLEEKCIGETYNEKFEYYVNNNLRFNLLEDFKHYLDNNDNIIIDMTNLTFDNNDENSVVNFINLARNNNYTIIAIVLNVKFETILERNEKRRKIGKYIPVNILKSMQKKFEKLKKNDYEIIQTFF